MSTIFALSSGAPPAGIGVLRVTGPAASRAVEMLAGSLPAPRRAERRVFRDASGNAIDDGLILWFPGPASVTGEDVAELHVHGGRAVIAAMEAALAGVPGLRRAQAGEFTRRAFANGRIDLAEAEGLADLLSAETELQRQTAMGMARGRLSRRVDDWRERLLSLSAQVEAVLDFGDEDDVSELPRTFGQNLRDLLAEIESSLSAPAVETLREGFRVALAGPPNAGKSTLFNALVESEAAITAPREGTTRDVLVRSVAIGGVPFSFVDMAGLRSESADEVEAIGIERAEAEIARADLVLWLGPEGRGPAGAWEIEAQCDRTARVRKVDPRLRLSAQTGEGMQSLRSHLLETARLAMPKPGEAALNRRQRELLGEASCALQGADRETDPLIIAEELRRCRTAFDALLGRTSTEEVLDALFGRFCIGK